MIRKILIIFIFYCLIGKFLWDLIVKEHSIKEIAIRYRDFVWEIIKFLLTPTPKPEPNYPLCIGSDGYQIVPELVDKEFSEVESNFDVCYCDSSCLIEEGSCIRYRFSIQRKKDALEDKDTHPLIQKQTEKIAFHCLQREGINIPAEAVTLVELYPNYMYVAFALSRTGIEHLTNRKSTLRRLMNEKSQQKPIIEKWGNREMIFGYQKVPYDEHGISQPITLPIEVYTNMLISSSSGSGKTYSLLFLIGRLLQEKGDSINLTICDFKNSNEFSFLKGYPSYYAGESCYDGIMTYFHELMRAREENGYDDGKRHFLIVDEWPALVTYLEMRDKREKTRRAMDVLEAVSIGLMTGRGIGANIWIITQRADASLFLKGARDSYMLIISLGRISKEQKGMLFAGEDLPENRVYSVGEGLLLADGRELIEVKFPLIKDLPDWQKHIKDILMKSVHTEE